MQNIDSFQIAKILDGEWKTENRKDSLVFMIMSQSQTFGCFFVQPKNSSETVLMGEGKTNGTFYTVNDGILINFSYFSNVEITLSGPIIIHSHETCSTAGIGKIFFTHPDVLHLEVFTGLNRKEDYYTQYSDHLHELSDHENLIYKKVK
jgi:hypothetical protein